MASDTARAIEHVSRIIRDDDALIEPLLRFVAIIAPPRGDPAYLAMREKVLDHLYGMTADAREHRRAYLSEGQIEATTSSVS